MNHQWYIDNGFLDVQSHPVFPLRILDYSRKTQMEKHWDSITLQCRGLVVDSNYTPINNPLPKFFNMEELPVVPLGEFKVYEKLDGSCGITYYWDNQHHICTRGSFVSEQALFADNLLKTKYSHVQMDPELTYIFEIIYPENWVVVKYEGISDIILTAVRDKNGDLPLEMFSNIGFKVVQEFPHRDFKQMKALNIPNKEGFVVHFANGDRMKIKFEDYCQMHSNRFNLSSKSVFGAFKKGIQLEEFTKDFPDEFDSWIVHQYNRFEQIYQNKLNGVKSVYRGAKKHFVEAVKSDCQNKDLFSSLMTMYDGVDEEKVKSQIISQMERDLVFEKAIPFFKN